MKRLFCLLGAHWWYLDSDGSRGALCCSYCGTYEDRDAAEALRQSRVNVVEVEEELDIGDAGLVRYETTVLVLQACDFCEGTGRAFCDSEPCWLCRCC